MLAEDMDAANRLRGVKRGSGPPAFITKNAKSHQLRWLFLYLLYYLVSPRRRT